MGTMSYMNSTGDLKVMWDADNEAEVAAAKAQFETLVSEKGYMAFAVNKKGDPGERIKKFDPQAEKIIIVPPMRGG